MEKLEAIRKICEDIMEMEDLKRFRAGEIGNMERYRIAEANYNLALYICECIDEQEKKAVAK
jgi:hypothetical protein